MKIRREWAMPNKNTFECQPIGAFVDYYLQRSNVSVDPFARNFQGCTYTNDLNQNTKAEYHMDALEFLVMLKDKGVVADLIIFDPPYSPRQLKECYDNCGIKMKQFDAFLPNHWKDAKDIIQEITKVGSIFLWFGWSTSGMGMSRNFYIEEILLVNHGVSHNDTICMAEVKTAEQLKMF